MTGGSVMVTAYILGTIQLSKVMFVLLTFCLLFNRHMKNSISIRVTASPYSIKKEITKHCFLKGGYTNWFSTYKCSLLQNAFKYYVCQVSTAALNTESSDVIASSTKSFRIIIRQCNGKQTYQWVSVHILELPFSEGPCSKDRQ